MASLPFVALTGQSVGWNMCGIAEGLRMVSGQRNLANKQTSIFFKQSKEPACEDDDMELRSIFLNFYFLC